MKTYKLTNSFDGLGHIHAIYNGLDCMATYECYQGMKLDEGSQIFYDLLLSCRAPAMEMSMRGVRVDEYRLKKFIVETEKEILEVSALWNKLVEPTGTPINWRSPKQLQELFYTRLKLPKQYLLSKITVNRGARDKLAKENKHYAKFFDCINFMDEHEALMKKLVPVKGRVFTSFNITGTKTGRWSSSKCIIRDGGTNLQNVTDRLRDCLIPDPGKIFVYVDLAQAESRASGLCAYRVTGKSNYLDACESEDLHSMVSNMVWPGKDPQEVYYRDFTRRHMAKVLGHGSNYNGQPWTMSKHTKIPQKEVKAFQMAYFAAFPELKEWHAEIQRSLLNDGYIITLLGIKRDFFGNPRDNKTLNDAIAADPQSSATLVMLKGLRRVWDQIPEAQPLVQLHDGNLFQIPSEREDLIPKLTKLHEIPITTPTTNDKYNVATRTIVIPAEAKIGFNWKNSEMSTYAPR